MGLSLGNHQLGQIDRLEVKKVDISPLSLKIGKIENPTEQHSFCYTDFDTTFMLQYIYTRVHLLIVKFLVYCRNSRVPFLLVT